MNTHDNPIFSLLLSDSMADGELSEISIKVCISQCVDWLTTALLLLLYGWTVAIINSLGSSKFVTVMNSTKTVTFRFFG